MRALRLRKIRRENGLAYVAFTGRRRASSHRRASSAVLLEDGVPLPGPANALHDDIRRLGSGRYSFWHASVYFSAPDNSDPRTNGRTYSFILDSSLRSAVLSLVPLGLRASVARVVRGGLRRVRSRSLSGDLWRYLYWVAFASVLCRGAAKRVARRLL